MDFKETFIKGCFELQPKILEDSRGRFVKPYYLDTFTDKGIDFKIKEEYYSVSEKNVLRGLHFQTPPMATAKLVTCIDGEIFDVVVDLRKNSSSYLKYFHVNLFSGKGNMLFIPEGLAHGFCVLSEQATMLYMCSEVYSPENDSGIRWNSAGVKWPVENPIVSEKDNSLTELHKFDNPF